MVQLHFENGSLKTAISFFKNKNKKVYNVKFEKELIEQPISSINIFK